MTARRRISDSRRARIFEARKGLCHLCGEPAGLSLWDIEHIVPLALDGKDDDENMAPAHRSCHAPKTIADLARIAKMKRQHIRHIGAHRSRRPMPGGRGSKWKKRMDGSVERR